MLGCVSPVAILISRWNRSAPTAAAKSGCRSLMATLRSNLVSTQRYTVAIPPRPSSRSMRYRSPKEGTAAFRTDCTGTTTWEVGASTIRMFRPRRQIERRSATVSIRVSELPDAFFTAAKVNGRKTVAVPSAFPQRSPKRDYPSAGLSDGSGNVSAPNSRSCTTSMWRTAPSWLSTRSNCSWVTYPSSFATSMWCNNSDVHPSAI